MCELSGYGAQQLAKKTSRSSYSPLKVISLFTGAGGLDLGFEAAGYSTVACVELDATARETLTRNRPEWNLLDEGDIHRVLPTDLLRTANLSVGDVDVVLGGPPCQPFSKAAFWVAGETLRLADPRASTLSATMDIVGAVLPRAVVIENVRGIAYRDKGEAISLIQRRFKSINRRHRTRYHPDLVVLSATAYGVPQVRERAFIVAFRDGQRFVAPTPTHGDELLPVATAWDAIGGMRPSKKELAMLQLRGKWADLLPSIPEGSNYLFHTARGGGLPLFGWRTRYWSFLLKLARNEPSWTLQAAPGPATGPFHWQNRLLSVQEMMALQTFPKGYEIAGSYNAARRQIGNAVPSALAEAVARQVRAILTGENLVGPSILATQPRQGSPRTRRPQPVPAKYLSLIGEHAEHPGNGRGPGAQQRHEMRSPEERSITQVVNQSRRGAKHPDAEAINLGSKQFIAA